MNKWSLQGSMGSLLEGGPGDSLVPRRVPLALSLAAAAAALKATVSSTFSELDLLVGGEPQPESPEEGQGGVAEQCHSSSLLKDVEVFSAQLRPPGLT